MCASVVKLSMCSKRDSRKWKKKVIEVFESLAKDEAIF